MEWGWLAGYPRALRIHVERLRRRKGGPLSASPVLTPNSSPNPATCLCLQALLQEQGWQQLEQLLAQRRSQALLTLHRGLRACITRQRLRFLPRMQARVRGLQAR